MIRRVVHVCLRYPPASGGVENYVRDLVEGTRNFPLPTAAYSSSDNLRPTLDVRVLSSRLRTHHPATLLSGDSLLSDPPYLQRLHHLSTPHLAYPRLQSLPYYLNHHQPDLIHAYSYWYQPADVAARYAARRHLPFLFHPMYYFNSNRQKVIWQLYRRWIGNKTFSLATAVVVISPFEQSLIERDGYQVKKFVLIPPGIDLSRYGRQYLNPYLKRGLTGKIILSVARLAPGKGLVGLIKSFPMILKNAPDAKLVLVGEDFGLQSTLIKLIADLGLTGQVHLLGFVPDVELPAYFQHATILIHPSHYEAFGIVLAEALAAGLPVVARDTGAVSFVAPPGIGSLLFTSRDQLIAHCLSLLRHQPQRNLLARRGNQYVRSNFSRESTLNKIADLYQEISPS